MSHNDAFLWTARLLRYPDPELAAMAQGRGAMGKMPYWATAFLEHVAATPLLDIQADFVHTFDLNPSASLYLTTHVYKDSPLQGRALAALLELYREGGCDPAHGELPDYLPMALEFLAVAPPWAATCLCEKFAPVVNKIAAHLTATQSPWAGMMHASACAMQACVPAISPNKAGQSGITPDAPNMSNNSSREVCV